MVLLGDSLAYGTGDEKRQGIAGRLDRDQFETVNLGVNGAQTSDLMARLRQERTRTVIGDADAIVLSIGANDLFRGERGRAEALRDPFGVAERILDRIAAIVDEIHRLAPAARVLILGGYNPVPGHPLGFMIEHYLQEWDGMLIERFRGDSLISVVAMKDIVTPQHLSRWDGFHPGEGAYDAAAKRIAAMLSDE